MKTIFKIINRTIKFLRNKDYRFRLLSEIGLYDRMPDKEYLFRRYKSMMGKELNLCNPRTFNEKIQWLKLYNRNPEYTLMVDKVEVKKWVAKVIGEQYVIPTIGVWDKPEDIDFDSLPNQFVLKCNHNSGIGMYICQDKNKINKRKILKNLKKGLRENKYLSEREWAYKNVKRRILAEKFMQDKESEALNDYKFFCFNGEVKALYIATERQNPCDETRFDFFDADYNHLEFTNAHPNAIYPPAKPHNFELMKKIACKLSKGIPHVRVDLYEVDGQVFFGEMTFYHMSGMFPFSPEEWDYTFGSWITLPQRTNEK